MAAGAGGDELDEIDKSILLLLTSNERGEDVEKSSLSLIASSANLAKSKRFCDGLDFVRL